MPLNTIALVFFNGLAIFFFCVQNKHLHLFLVANGFLKLYIGLLIVRKWTFLIPKVLFIPIWIFVVWNGYLRLQLFLEAFETFYEFFNFFGALWEANFYKKRTYGLGVTKVFSLKTKMG